MSLPTAYLTSFRNTPAILQSIQAAQAPDRFTVKFLEGLGYASSNDRAMINVLKALGFLDDSGVPKRRYHEYLDQTQSEVILADGIREAEEAVIKWHGARSENLLSYTELKHLPDIIGQNWEDFEPYVLRQDWAASIFAVLERSRNVIMHSGVLALSDVERVGINMREWNKQVGL